MYFIHLKMYFAAFKLNRESEYLFSLAILFHVVSQCRDFPSASLHLIARAMRERGRPYESDWLIVLSQSFDDDGNSSSRKVCHSLCDEMKLREEGRMIFFLMTTVWDSYANYDRDDPSLLIALKKDSGVDSKVQENVCKKKKKKFGGEVQSLWRIKSWRKI